MSVNGSRTLVYFSYLMILKQVCFCHVRFRASIQLISNQLSSLIGPVMFGGVSRFPTLGFGHHYAGTGLVTNCK